jgi:predicted glutamine amidotransferase
MCELFCLSSRVPTRATLSLQRFAERGGYGNSAIDGWGLAFYDGPDVRLYKEPEPAANSPWISFIEERRLPTPLLVSHIRHATRGALSHANTQPFMRELGGRMHVFAHNGRLDEIEARYAGAWRRFRPIGETDSEIAFCILLERMAPLWSGEGAPLLQERLAVVARFAAEMRALGPANFLYADGDVLFAHGHRRLQVNGEIAPPGLWYLQRRCACDADALSMPEDAAAHAGEQELILIASVPLTAEAWTPFAEGQVMVVKDGAIAPASVADIRGKGEDHSG